METRKPVNTACFRAPFPSCSAAHAEGLDDAQAAPRDGRSPQFRDRFSSRGIPELVDTKTAATILGRSSNTLKRWRHEGVGPDYVLFQGRVRYDIAVLRDYIAKNTRTPSVRAASERTDRGIV
jgi:hypothetical protein